MGLFGKKNKNEVKKRMVGYFIFDIAMEMKDYAIKKLYSSEYAPNEDDFNSGIFVMVVIAYVAQKMLSVVKDRLPQREFEIAIDLFNRELLRYYRKATDNPEGCLVLTTTFALDAADDYEYCAARDYMSYYPKLIETVCEKMINHNRADLDKTTDLIIDMIAEDIVVRSGEIMESTHIR